MDNKELAQAVRRVSVETGSLVCLGCGHEHNCSIKGCAILREAAAVIDRTAQICVAAQRVENQFCDAYCMYPGMTPDETTLLLNHCATCPLTKLSASLPPKAIDSDGEDARTSLLRRAINIYGERAQEDMMIEEMSELTKAICKHRRGGSVADMIEEMADVQIMLDQMKIMYGDTRDMERSKLDRLEKRIEGKCEGDLSNDR